MAIVSTLKTNKMNSSKSLECITVNPLQPATRSVIWLHGLGADGHDFVNIIPELNLPNSLSVRFIFPHAPIRPVTINAGMPMRAWFDIYSLTHLNQEDQAGMEEGSGALVELIEQEISLGINSRQIVLAGFSQGGALALYTGLRYGKPLAGILGLSTYLPRPSCLKAEASKANQQTPIFIAHGDFDPVLPVLLGKEAYRVLKQLDYPVQWHTYPMEHVVCLEEIGAISQWLKIVFTTTGFYANDPTL